MLFQGLRWSNSLPDTQKHEFLWNSWYFMKLLEIPLVFMKFGEIGRISGFSRFLGCQAPQTLLFPKENIGSVKCCGWLKTQDFMIFHRFYEISEISLKSINPHNFLPFHKISAPQRCHAKMQWFLCFPNGCSAHIPPRALQNLIFHGNIGFWPKWWGISWNLAQLASRMIF